MSEQPEINPASDKSERVYEPSRVVRNVHAEGSFTRLLEHHTAKVPSDVFLFAGLGAMGLSLYLQLRKRHEESRFVGMWAPVFLTMGVYNKMVKLIGTR